MSRRPQCLSFQGGTAAANMLSLSVKLADCTTMGTCVTWRAVTGKVTEEWGMYMSIIYYYIKYCV